MPRTMSNVALAATILALVTQAPEVQAQATSAAETACMEAVNRNYGGRVRDLRVVDSEFSQANSRVYIEADGERWNCLSSNDGYVEELRVEEGGRHDGGHGQGSGSGGGVTIYADYGFRGASETIHGNVVDMKQTRIGNDALSSVRVPRGCTVMLFADNNFRGRYIELTRDEPELGRTEVGNDSVSSISVSCN